MTADRTFLVTGASGNTGSRIVKRLVSDGRSVRAASRKATPVVGAAPVAFDWSDPSTHDAALDGAEGVYLVPPPGAMDPAAAMLPFLDRAKRAGVRRAVLLSASQVPSGGPGAGTVHRVLPDTFEEWAVLRPSWFMQNFTGRHLHADSIRTDGLLMTATGQGRVAFIDADDIAAVAVRALTDRTPHNTDWILTGPEALSYDDVAATLSEVTGRPVHHRALSERRMRERYAREMPEDFAATLAAMDRMIADGAEDRITDSVEHITGRPPRSFASYAKAHAHTQPHARSRSQRTRR